MNPSTPVFACNLYAIPENERAIHQARTTAIFSTVLERSEDDTQMSFRLPFENELLMSVAHFIANERLCCPFLVFTVTLDAPNESLWLHIGGSVEAKAVLQMELGDMLKTG